MNNENNELIQGGNAPHSQSPEHHSPPSEEVEDAPAAEATVYVDWILPSQANNTTKDDSERTTRFAPVLFERRWSEIETPEGSFPGPPTRSPACTKRGLKDLKHSVAPNKSSPCMINLFNRIREHVLAQGGNGVYNQGAFENAFEEEDDSAVVASRSGANPIITLNGNYTATVTLRHESEEHETATIEFIRRSPPDSDDVEYFVTAPAEQSLTVNGRTYASREGNRLFVGPLGGLTVIELLSQPFFFFRTRENLQVSRANGVRAKRDEMGRRDGNGEMQDRLVDIVWAPIIAPRPTPTPPHTPTLPPAPTPPPSKPPGSEGPKGRRINIKGKQAVAKQPEQAIRPCEELRRRLRELNNDKAIRERLRNFRRANIRSDPDFDERWLSEEDIVTAIAAVASAISERQGTTHGFSIPSTEALDNLQLQVPFESWVPRFCRPMMFPVLIGEHLVIALVQMNRNGEVSFSILDSMFTYLSARLRQQVFNRVRDTVRYTNWWRHRYAAWEHVPTPRTAQWIPCAQQPTETECGYYAIIFAWALALGLELNPHAAPIWDESLFQEVLDIAHLARLGLVDWTLIHNFLRCHRFVLNGAVPERRRFEQSEQLLTSADWNHRSGRLREQEDMDHAMLQGIHLENLMGNNFIQLPPGLAHNSNSFLPRNYRNGAQGTLSLSGRLRFGTPRTHFDILDRHYVQNYRSRASTKDVGDNEGRFFRDWLETSAGVIDEANSDKLFIWYRAFLANKRVQRENEDRLRSEPCVLASEGLNRMRYLLGQPSINATFANLFPGTPANSFLDENQVGLAIAAVVEAIDRHQVDNHDDEESPFTGGFALSVASDARQIARSGTRVLPGSVSRPRRCFFLPMTVLSTEIAEAKGEEHKGEVRGHTFLAVVQEEGRNPTPDDPARSHFVIRTFDSGAHRFQDERVQNYFYTATRNTAEGLGWSEQRNTTSVISFKDRLLSRAVIRQRPGGWQCGLHTILNAWILALGLTPNTTTTALNDEFYNELWDLVRGAVAGLLDWQTLAAWLYCKRITELRAVPHSRRFELSRSQKDGEFANRIEEIFRTDDRILETKTVGDLPYDYRNNIAMAGQRLPDTTRIYADEFRFAPGSKKYSMAKKCTPKQLKDLLAASEDDRARLLKVFTMSLPEKEAQLLKLLDERQRQVWAETDQDDQITFLEDWNLDGSEDSDEDPDEGLNRAFDNCGVPRRGGLKRKADAKLGGSYHDGSLSTPRKRYKLNCSSRRVLRSCVDADGDVRMG